MHHPYSPDDLSHLLDELADGPHADATTSEHEHHDHETPPMPEADTRPQLHVYVMNRPLEEQLADWLARTDAVESTPPVAEEPEAPITQPVSVPRHPRRWILPACLLALMCLLGGIVYTWFNPFETTTATITIIPSVKTVTSTSTVTLSPQPSTAVRGKVEPAHQRSFA